MDTPPGPATRPRRLLPERWLRWLLPLTLVITGAGLIVLASAFVLTASWDGSAASTAGQASDPAAGQQGPPSSTFQGQPLGVGAGFARLNARAFFGGLARVAVAREPTPTPTPTPAAPTATPKPAVTEQPFVPQPPPASQPAAPPAAPADPPAAPTDPPAASCSTASMSGLGLDLFNAINNERTSLGMAGLAADGCVVYVAQLRSNDMASRGYFSHTSPDGETAFSIMDSQGVPYGWAGENLARNNYPDDQAVGVAIHDLMASPGHRDNILGPNYTSMGVAAVNDGTGMWYFTMIFIGPP